MRASLSLPTLLAACALAAGASVAEAQSKEPPVAKTVTPVKRKAEPLRGTASLDMLKPVVKVVGKEVVTTLKIKNVSYGPVARLRVDEYWYDKAGNTLPGDFKIVPRIEPAEIVTIELRTPKNASMQRNSYQFSHANGRVTTKVVPKLE